jgi:Ser/Thr protein kinase RdoA (MazF antagonist)
MPSEPSEEILAGGNLSHVVRVGDTVRRPTGAWTPTIHALLRHLDAAGYDGAPRVFGIDDEGREILEFIPGATAWPQMGALATDDGLARAAQLLRRYHEAVADFVVPDDAAWQMDDMRADGERYLAGEAPIVCHNDCAAWNLVLGVDDASRSDGRSGRWAFIDWDVAGPRPRLWDVAYAIRGMVLCDPSAALADRVDLFSREYGLDVAERRRLPEIVLARIASSIEMMRRRAEAGVEPWTTMWAGGHGTAWNDTLALARRVFA